MKKSVRQKPKLTHTQQTVEADQISAVQDTLRNVSIETADLRVIDGKRLLIDGSILTDCTFVEMDVSSASFTDTVFERCDFSNMTASRIDVLRCEFRNCKLMGANFDHSSMKHVLFQQCDGRYGSFNFSMMQTVQVENAQFSDVDFFECVFKEMKLTNTQLDNANFRETDLAGVNLSDCTFERIEVTPTKIANCIVSKEQAIGFAQMLGLLIEDES